MRRAEEFIPVSKQSRLPDGTWVAYFRGRYDSRDIMCDCVRPIWAYTDEYQVKIVPPGCFHSSDYVFRIKTDKVCGNYVASLINQGKFPNMKSILIYFKKLCTALGTYERSYRVQYGEITMELWNKYKESQEVSCNEETQ